MWKLIHDTNLRRSSKDGIGIHFLEPGATVFDTAARSEFETRSLRNCVGTAMRLEVADHNVLTLTL